MEAACGRGILKDRFSGRKERLAPWKQTQLSGKVGRKAYRVCREEKEGA